jgi:CBS domain-containing protein
MNVETLTAPLRVADLTHAGIVRFASNAFFAEPARVMSDHRVHAVAVADFGDGRPWGTWPIASDSDNLSALEAGREPAARKLAGTDAATISGKSSRVEAARLMSERRVSHLVALNASGGYPSASSPP